MNNLEFRSIRFVLAFIKATIENVAHLTLFHFRVASFKQWFAGFVLKASEITHSITRR